MQTYLALATHPMLWVFLGLLAGFYLILWATALDARRLSPRTVWLRRNYPAVILTGVAILAIVALTFYLIEIGISVRVLVDRLRLTAMDPQSAVDDLQSLASAVAILVGVLAAAATILYSSIRVWINERTATATEEGLITDRINKAVQGLGAEKTENRLGRTVRYTVGGVDGSYFEWIDEPRAPPSDPDVVNGKVKLTNEPWSSFPNTRPNLEVRIGSVYALERIAQDSARDHVQIMEILCAYIRHNAPANPALVFPEDWSRILGGDVDDDEFDIPSPTRTDIMHWARTSNKPREDIQAALTVIGRRSDAQIGIEGHVDAEGDWSGYRLDLRETCLQGADFGRGNFDNALLARAQCRGANFSSASLSGADLGEAHLDGADFEDAQLMNAGFQTADIRGAFFHMAQLHGANFYEAEMQLANFSNAKMHDVILYRSQAQNTSFEGAEMQGANLESAQLQGSDLLRAQLQRANLGYAGMTRADLRWAELGGADMRHLNVQCADLRSTRLHGAKFDGAQMQGSDLSEVEMDATTVIGDAALRGAALRFTDLTAVSLMQAQLDSAFGDQTVIVPPGLIRPETWPSEELEWVDYPDQWRAWQNRIGFDPEDPETW